jgi:hypothetical protein
LMIGTQNRDCKHNNQRQQLIADRVAWFFVSPASFPIEPEKQSGNRILLARSNSFFGREPSLLIMSKVSRGPTYHKLEHLSNDLNSSDGGRLHGQCSPCHVPAM